MEDMIRIGFISSVNMEDGSAKITYQDRDKMVTEDFPFLAFGGEYCVPEVNDMVLVVHLSNDISSGVIMGKYWNDENMPETQEWYKRISEKMVMKKQENTLVIEAPEILFSGTAGSITLSQIIGMEQRIRRLEALHS